MRNKGILVGLFAATLFLPGCAMIGPGERGVKVELGVVDPHLLQPGVNPINPFTQGVETFSLKQNTVEGSSNPLTSDQQPLDISFRVQYKLPEGQILNLYQNVKGDPYEMLVVPQIQEAFRQVVSQYKAEWVIGNVNAVKDQVLSLVRKNVGSSVEIVDMPITHIGLPSALQSAIIEKQQMEIAAKKKQYELDKEKKQAEITVTKARAEAESIKLQSEALANSPKLVELKWVEKWNGKLPETMAGNSSLIMGIKK